MILDALERDIRAGLRTMRRYPGVTALALLSLTLGIGANTLAFSFLNALFGELGNVAQTLDTRCNFNKCTKVGDLDDPAANFRAARKALGQGIPRVVGQLLDA